MPPSEADLKFFEQEQGFFKHIATLATGSIVLIAGYVGKGLGTNQPPGHVLLIALALAGNFASIAATVSLHYYSLSRDALPIGEGMGVKGPARWMGVVAHVSFLLSLLALGAYAILLLYGV